jgi:hypothetical protein
MEMVLLNTPNLLGALRDGHSRSTSATKPTNLTFWELAIDRSISGAEHPMREDSALLLDSFFHILPPHI